MAATDILRRKAAAGRKPPEIAALTPEKAMRLAFGRAGRELPGLRLALASFGMERATVAALVDAVPDAALVMLAARGDGASGALVCDAGFVAAVLEAETTGRLRPSAPPERPPTRIDALVAGGFLDRALALFDEAGGGLSIAAAACGFRCGEMLASAAMLPLVLEDMPYRLMRLGFGFDGGRKGAVLLALPLDPPAHPGEAVAGEPTDAALMEAPADLRAVLARLSLPLEAVSGWTPGTLLPLRREVLEEVRLEDIEGNPVAGGRLGQMNGARAVRLRGGGPPPP